MAAQNADAIAKQALATAMSNGDAAEMAGLLSPYGLAYLETRGGTPDFKLAKGFENNLLQDLLPGCVGGGEMGNCRTGFSPSLHWSGERDGFDLVHLDQANPAAFGYLGVIFHVFLDISGELNSSYPYTAAAPWY